MSRALRLILRFKHREVIHEYSRGMKIELLSVLPVNCLDPKDYFSASADPSMLYVPVVVGYSFATRSSCLLAQA